MSVDPSNDKTFWFVSEYFNPGRRDLVGTFQIAANYANDIGVVSVELSSIWTFIRFRNGNCFYI